MHHFGYRHGHLHAEDCAVNAIVDTVGTPCYGYSTATLTRHFTLLRQAFSAMPAMICYAMKANSNQAVIKTLTDLGAGVDVVSQGELRRARALGISGERIVFSGVGKTAEEMALGIEMGIACFNVESEPELELLNAIAVKTGTTAPIAIRVNPDVDAQSHRKITTGTARDKFGIALTRARAVYARAKALPGLRVTGIDMHIGSQITSLEPFARALGRLGDMVTTLRADGHDIAHIDIGGGLGVPYRTGDNQTPGLTDYAALISRTLGPLDCRLILEPGRLITANAGILLTKVLYIKRAGTRTFVITDAAMTELIRPTLYDAYHEIMPVKEPCGDAPEIPCDVVGPVCESGDYLALNRPLPPLKAGDYLAFMTAGAYGAVQSGTYNTRPLVPEVLVKGGDFAVVRPRQSYEALIGLDRLAPWQATA